MRERYWLSRYWFVCSAGRSLVCFNLRDNKYCMLEAHYANAIRDQVPGWPSVEPDQEVRSETDEPLHAEDIAADLLTRGILVREPSQGKDAVPVSISVPATALLDEYDPMEVALTGRDLAQFTCAAFSAATLVSLRSTIAILRHLHRRKRIRDRSKDRASTGAPSDITEMKRILAVFRRLRPLLWKVKDQRLFERFVLLKLFGYRGFYPQWIFGISMDPFKRHSWLQCGDTVIDEAPEVASSFVPIVAF